MKLLNTLVTSFTIAVASQAYADQRLCEAFVDGWDESDDVQQIAHVESADELTERQKAMVQIAMLLNNTSKPISVHTAIKRFFDGGPDAGTLAYYRVKLGAKTYTVARVSHLPGDSEFGALFRISDSDQHSSLLATIADGDFSCLQ